MKLWDVATSRCVQTYKIPNQSGKSTNSGILGALPSDSDVSDATSNSSSSEKSSKTSLSNAKFSWDNKKVFGSFGSEILVFETLSGTPLGYLKGHNKPILHIDSAEGYIGANVFVSCSRDDRARLWSDEILTS